jgi:hypothetical protein
VTVTERDGRVVGAMALSTLSTTTAFIQSDQEVINPLLDSLQRYSRKIREATILLPRLPAG